MFSFITRSHPTPKSYARAPARRKAGGARKRKSALYSTMTGIQMLRIRLPNCYVRSAPTLA